MEMGMSEKAQKPSTGDNQTIAVATDCFIFNNRNDPHFSIANENCQCGSLRLELMGGSGGQAVIADSNRVIESKDSF